MSNVGARIVELIKVEVQVGDGKETPFRGAYRFYERDGQLVADFDFHWLTAVRKFLATNDASYLDQVRKLLHEQPNVTEYMR